ncbi:MAG: hypothetical protein EOP62_10600 [Sphingomonadales bacterium]|nr:MAG: hypothetical protein EOP62_10600 [Sphingomonadales bacterium]
MDLRARRGSVIRSVRLGRWRDLAAFLSKAARARSRTNHSPPKNTRYLYLPQAQRS